MSSRNQKIAIVLRQVLYQDPDRFEGLDAMDAIDELIQTDAFHPLEDVTYHEVRLRLETVNEHDLPRIRERRAIAQRFASENERLPE